MKNSGLMPDFQMQRTHLVASLVDEMAGHWKVSEPQRENTTRLPEKRK
jgi:hypothetical protein